MMIIIKNFKKSEKLIEKTLKNYKSIKNICKYFKEK